MDAVTAAAAKSICSLRRKGYEVFSFSLVPAAPACKQRLPERSIYQSIYQSMAALRYSRILRSCSARVGKSLITVS
jgi:hypothetical protein